MSSLPVKPELGPPLSDVAGPRWRRLPRVARLALIVLAALVVLALVWRVAGGGGAAGADETPVVVREGGAPFNLRYGAGLERAEPPQSELLRLVDARGGEQFRQSFTVEPLSVPPYRGFVSGALPVAAERLKAGLEREFDGFRLIEEGRTRINEVPGYEVVFTARGEDGRTRYGRWVMMLPLTDPPTPQRRGVTLELLGTFSPETPNVGSIGDQGRLKLPLRTFRFGTEAP